jgi:hypothetical protein
MENKVIDNVHISQIKVGDTIMVNGEMKTVSGNNLKKGGFCGTTIFGDSYNSGRKLVGRVRFAVPTNKGVVLR